MKDATSNMDILQQGMKSALNVPADNPEERIIELNDQYLLGENQRDAVDWAWPQESGSSMFNIIQTYTRAVPFDSLSAQERFRLQEVGGEILSDLKIAC